MRFDDSLRTVLQSDISTSVGARSAWRQLVDLAGRGRAPTDEPVIARLRSLRDIVPIEVRAASARALAYARPDRRLVGFFAEDELAVAAPVVRTAELAGDDWVALLPRLTPALRSVLRHRRDLPGGAVRALQSFGPVDFALPRPALEPLELQPAMIDAPEPGPEPTSPALDTSPSENPSVEEEPSLPEAEPLTPSSAGFAIPDLVARIEAFRRRRDERGHAEADETAVSASAPEGFRFETDASGLVIGVEGVARGTLIGLSMAHSGVQGLAQLDATAIGALRRRSRFEGARLEVGGESSAAGSWRLSGLPAFEPSTGRFTGFRGVGRRPRADEVAARPTIGPSADSLRQLVHELRTPTNAIAGFAELIESELLTPVPDAHRARAAAIRTRAADLLAAIEDLDTASRIEMGALELRPGSLPLRPMVERVVDDLAPLAAMRGVQVALGGDEDGRLTADDQAAERLVSRVLATLIAAGTTGETLRVSVDPKPSSVELAVDRPRALLGLDADALLSLDGTEAEEGAPLLGTGFALRVARNLAAELGGVLELGPERLTLRLPAAVDRLVEHATTI